MSSPEVAIPAVERTVLLDTDIDHVLEALSSPDLLSAWLGEWNGSDDDAATVVTDDGVVRNVRRLDSTSANQVSWRWSPSDDPASWTDVRFTLTTVGERTQLTVVESPSVPSRVVASASASAPAVPWVGCLLALGAVLALGSLVAV